MKTLYLDCQAGIAGDMSVAALLDLGLPLPYLQGELAKLPLPKDSFCLTAETVVRQGISATLFHVEATEASHHRHYSDIRQLLAESALHPSVKESAGKIFRKLAEAEAKVHGLELDEVHFHEVGAIDSIVDIVGASVGLQWLGVESLITSPLPLGSGWVETAHGRLPVPAPATLELLRGLRVHSSIGEGERVTPTGAAIVAALAQAGDLPPCTIVATGYGAGTREYADTPNLLRALLLEMSPSVSRDRVVVLETHLDDCSPEILGYLMEMLQSHGALDVSFSPLQMKKNRPGTKLTVIAPPGEADRLGRLVLQETTALGVRFAPMDRMILARENEIRQTSYGPVSVKVVRDGTRILRVTPEYEECRRCALEQGLPLQEVYQRIMLEIGRG